jgi:quinol monooxygenase YgiN
MNDYSLFTSGSWIIKPGKEDAFIKLWSDFAKNSNVPGAGSAVLLQDNNNSRHFISFGDWENQQIVDKWRGSTEFKEFFDQVMKIVEKVDVYTLDKIADTKN